MTLDEIPYYAELMTQGDDSYDFSVESLSSLDSELAALREHLLSLGEPAAVLNANPSYRPFVCSAGAYAGEVLRRNVGGEWRFDDVWWPSLQSAACTIFPFTRTYKFLVEGPENSWSCLASSYRAFTEVKLRATPALSASDGDAS
jgi:hypothetical protein